MYTRSVQEGFLVVYITVEEKDVAVENVYLIRQILEDSLKKVYGEVSADIQFDIVSHSPKSTVVRFPHGEARRAWAAFTCTTSYNSVPCQVKVLKFSHFIHSAFSEGSRSFDFNSLIEN